MERAVKQYRTLATELKTRAEPEGAKVIEGYFAVFNRQTELFPGGFEVIAPEAFNNTLGGDVRALINHDTTLVLGRTKASTLMLSVDGHGLYGKIIINEKDMDAMNLYERVQRGDVDQCSFGFEILSEETEWLEDGAIRWTIREVVLHEVSVCTFPAYEDTSVQARSKEYQNLRQKKLEARKRESKERLQTCLERLC